MPPKQRPVTKKRPNEKRFRPSTASIVGIVFALIVALVVGYTMLGVGKKSLSSAPLELIEGVPQDGFILGDPEAPVTLVQYIEPQCPHCKHYEDTVFPTLVADLVRAGKLKIEWRGVHFIGSDSEKALKYLVAAAKQNGLWRMSGLLFDAQGPQNSGWVTDSLLRESAKMSGLDWERLRRDAESAETKKIIQTFGRQSRDDKLTGTPFFLMGPSDGRIEVFTPYALAPDPFIGRALEIIDSEG
jgi:protein-disulfide isomerase